MKCGILTFHYTNNPGSVLQTYALQRIVSAFGVECDVVNYQVKHWLSAQYVPAIKRKTGLFWPLAAPLVLLLIRLSFVTYVQFRKKYIHIYPRKAVLFSESEMELLDKQYDKWIVGSDQVWNLDNPKVNDVLFLSFTDDVGKKVSYAASFGREDIPQEHEKEISKLLQDFSYISVRETQGVEIVKKLTGKDAELVLDPTLLLNHEQWSKIAQFPREQGYILVYLRQRSEPIARQAETLSKETRLPVITIRDVWPTTAVGKQVICPSPEKWLGYFFNARYVITNSFHGVAFSINLNKQFFAVKLEQRGSEKETSLRISSILDQFSLQDRLVTEASDLSQMDDIDYKSVNVRMSERRKESLCYLRKVLGFNDKHNAY